MSVGELVALGILVVIWIHSLLKINEQQCSPKEEPSRKGGGHDFRKNDR